MILLLFGSARAQIQPVRTINFLENQGFQVIYQPYLGIFENCGASDTPHVVHWWGNKGFPGGDFDYYPIVKKGVNQTDQIEYESQDEQNEDTPNIVIHFRDVRDMEDGNYLTYLRSPDSCPSSVYLNDLVEPNQWQPSDIKLKFRAKGGSAASVLTVSLALSSEYRLPGDDSAGDMILHLEEVGLSTSWDDYTITVPNSSMSTKSIELRFGLDPPRRAAARGQR